MTRSDVVLLSLLPVCTFLVRRREATDTEEADTITAIALHIVHFELHRNDAV